MDEDSLEYKLNFKLRSGQLSQEEYDELLEESKNTTRKKQEAEDEKRQAEQDLKALLLQMMCQPLLIWKCREMSEIPVGI